MKETLSVFTRQGTLTLSSLKIEFLFVKMLDILGSHVTAGLRVSQLGSLRRHFNFGHAHRWPLM